jgi:hypothetical protein
MAEFAAIYDGISDFITKLGSEIDPNATARIARDCREDAEIWYANGGVASIICEFWADRLATAINIDIEPNGKTKAAADRALAVQKYLIEKIQDLEVLKILRQAEITAAVRGGSPLMVSNDGQGRAIGRIKSIEIAKRNKVKIEPNIDRSIVETINSTTVFSRIISGNKVLLTANELIPFVAKAAIDSDDGFGHDESFPWGLPWIGGATIQAAKQYETGLLASNVLLQLKSFQEIGIKGLFEKLSGADSQAKQAELRSMLAFLATVSSNLSIRLNDMDESETKIIERSLAGVSDVLTALRNNLLIHSPDIPEVYLFQYREKGGINQGAAKADEERVDSRAAELWQQRWYQPIRQIIRILLLSSECPNSDFHLKDIQISRKSGYSPRPIEAASVAKIELETEIARWEFEQRVAAAKIKSIPG